MLSCLAGGSLAGGDSSLSCIFCSDGNRCICQINTSMSASDKGWSSQIMRATKKVTNAAKKKPATIFMNGSGQNRQNTPKRKAYASNIRQGGLTGISRLIFYPPYAAAET